MSRWTWMECIFWVGAIAAISSISHTSTNLMVADYYQGGSVKLPSELAIPDCNETDQEPFPFGIINIQQKSAAESFCYFFGPRNSERIQKVQPPLGFRVQFIR